MQGEASRCAVWGVLNVTPDSFSDGGSYPTVADAFARALAMTRVGASVIDVGGESSRPQGQAYGAGAEHVDAEEELRRVLPVVEQLVDAGMTVSVDTVKGQVAAASLALGAKIINDVSCGRDLSLIESVAAYNAELVLMHSRGHGEVNTENTAYQSVVDDVLREWDRAACLAEQVGVPRARLWLDPGLGFAKTPAQSAQVLASTSRFVAHGARVLIGASRKSFLASMAPSKDGSLPGPKARLGASVSAAVFAAQAGAHAVRVHDVYETAQALTVSAQLFGSEAFT